MNERIYKDFVDTTMILINHGYRKVSARLVADKLRWDHALKHKKFKCSNENIVLMSRRFEKDFPKYKGIFSKKFAKCDIEKVCDILEKFE